MNVRLSGTAVLLAGLLVVSSLSLAAPVSATSSASTACAGHVASPADGLTIVSVQGARFGGEASKTNARIIAYGPQGDVEWIHRSGKNNGIVWSYDIDPMPNGNLFVTATKPGDTVVYELNTQTGEREWVERLDAKDTHDVDLVAPDRIAVANMRNHNGSANNDRVYIYNLTTDEITWQWRFANHYDQSVGGNYTEDWTHVNDVDKVGEDKFLLSPRNFDQVILVNRTTGEIELKLGSDGNYDILHKQHNPDYLESEDGDPTFLVADSENNRIVEYEHTGSGWDRTWAVGNKSVFSWPRDADRLENGNTLVGDSRNNRVVEVTPDGDVVWEVYAPWLVYDVERIPGDGSNGPTMRDMGAPESPSLSNASPPSTAVLEQCDAALENMSNGFGESNSETSSSTQSTTRKQSTADDEQEQVQEYGPKDAGETSIAPRDAGGLLAATVVALLVAVWWRRQ